MSSAKPSPRTVVVQGHRMLLHEDAADRFVSGSLARTGAFEPFETELLLNELRPGDVVLDVGAHIGYYTLLFARAVGPQGHVFAFEPVPANFALLHHNVALNGYANVTAVNKAAADRAGPIRMFLSDFNAGDHRAYDSGDGRPSVAAEAVTLDDWFADYRGPIDLIKMDVQGAECAALEGMRGLLARWGRVKLFTEFWPAGLRAAARSAVRYLQMLEELGFRFYEISERHQALLRADPQRLQATYPPEKDHFTNLLCVKGHTGCAKSGYRPDGDERERWARAGDLRAFEQCLPSRDREAGILQELFRRLGEGGRFCVEIGAACGEEQPAWLIAERGWSGLLFEADARAFARMKERHREQAGCQVVQAHVTSANVEELLGAHGVPEDLDLLSIHLRGNDYWVWSAVRRWRPRVVVIEQNASHPPPRLWVMKEAPERAWDGTDYFGASLSSLVALGRRKGYSLVGTDSQGVKAFFVRGDLASPGPFLDTELHYHYSPPRYGPHRGGWPPGSGEFLEI